MPVVVAVIAVVVAIEVPWGSWGFRVSYGVQACVPNMAVGRQDIVDDVTSGVLNC